VYRRQFVQKLNFDFCFLKGVSDSEGFYSHNLFLSLNSCKNQATWGGGRSPPHQSRTAYIFKKKF
jgi:hypothetical protein